MPVYEYRRPDGTTFEILQKFSDETLTHDPETGVPVFKVFSAPAIHFKGKGFHNTDYGTKKRPVGGGESSSDGGGSESSSPESSAAAGSEGSSGSSESKGSTGDSSSGSSSTSGDGGSPSAPAAKPVASAGSKD